MYYTYILTIFFIHIFIILIKNYLITTAADEAQEAAEPVKNGLKGWLACLNKAKFSGCICGGNLENPAGANKQTELMKQAFEAGKNI